MPNPGISVCMIVKNEEELIERCLKSVHDLAKEIIIVDTGSTDGTVALCHKYGAYVYSYQWNDHFAEARNFGLTKAKGDWILWLDADEELESGKSEELLRTVSNTKAAMLLLPVFNYYGDSLPVKKDQVYLYYQPRLFRNHEGIRFINRIHESPELPRHLQSKDNIGTLEIPVHHYGYLKEMTERKNKSRRNLQLLMKELKNTDHSPWIEYHLASEFYRKEDYQTAFSYINQSILGFLKLSSMPPAILYRLKYDILLKTGSHEGAWPGIEKALLLYPDYVDLHFMKGLILYQKGEYPSALAAFEKCLQLGEKHEKYLITKGAGSFKANHYKHLCLQKIKNSPLK